MKECYIIKSDFYFLKSVDSSELVLTSDSDKAARFYTIGDAMKLASEENKKLGEYVFRVITIYE